MAKKVSAITHRAHALYSGRVQGIGFRYTAEKLAHNLGLVGYVKNLPNNSVELVCEGSKESIERLFEQIKKSSLGTHITKMNCSWESPTHEFKEFRIEFYL